MGKGDKKTKRGKIFMGSFGNKRPHHIPQSNGIAASTDAAPTEAVVEAPKKRATSTTKKKTTAKK